MAKAVRLDKFLADAGKGTRSEVKKFIQKGQVQVNGVPAKKPELKVDPEKDTVVLSGASVQQKIVMTEQLWNMFHLIARVCFR